MRYQVCRTPAGWVVRDIKTVSKIGLPHTLISRHGSDRAAADAAAKILNEQDESES